MRDLGLDLAMSLSPEREERGKEERDTGVWVKTGAAEGKKRGRT